MDDQENNETDSLVSSLNSYRSNESQKKELDACESRAKKLQNVIRQLTRTEHVHHSTLKTKVQ